MVGNLPDARLGVTLGHEVIIDSTAAGYGWSVDASARTLSQSGRMDLLSVIAHEMGNVMGFPEDAHETTALTSPTLRAGTRLDAHVGTDAEVGASQSGGGEAGRLRTLEWDSRGDLFAGGLGRDGAGLASAWLGDFSLTGRSRNGAETGAALITWRKAGEDPVSTARAKLVVRWVDDDASGDGLAVAGIEPGVEA